MYKLTQAIQVAMCIRTRTQLYADELGISRLKVELSPNSRHCTKWTLFSQAVCSLWYQKGKYVLAFRRTRTLTQTEVRNSDSDFGSDLRNRDFPTP
jgi:hypothetical protein